MEEAVKWLSYTYMFVRMKRNPLVYGITYKELSVCQPPYRSLTLTLGSASIFYSTHICEYSLVVLPQQVRSWFSISQFE